MKNLLLKKVEKRCVLLITLLIGSFGYAQIAQRGTATTATSANTTLTINKPTGLTVNDLMIVNLAQGNNNTNAPTSTGWTLLDGRSLAGANRYGAVLYKVANAADVLASNFVFTMGTGTNSASGAIIAFSGVDSSTPFDVSSGTISVQPSQINVSATSKTTVTANTAIIMLGQAAASFPSWSGWTTTSPGSLTELFDVQHNGGRQTSVGGAWALKASTGATGTGGATLSSAERNGGILLALRPCTTNTITLSSGVGTDAQTKCINTAITNITYNTTGATGATTSGLPTGVTGSWASNVYTISGTPTVAGTYNYTITLTGGCSTIVTKTGTITVIDLPTAVAGSDIVTCSTSGAVNITAGSSATNQSSVTWTSSGTGTFTNNTSLTTCTYNPSLADILAGSVTLTLTANGNTPCGNVTSTKTLTISNTMTAVAGTDVITCSTSGAVNITAGSSATNQTLVTWTSSGTGTFTNANSLTTCTYTPSAADIAAGTVTLTLTASNAGCSNVTSTKTLTINAAATATPAGPDTVCQSASPSAITLTGASVGGSATTGAWSITSGGGTLSSTAQTASPASVTYTPAANYSGTVTLTLTSNFGTGCAAATSTRTINVTAIATANAAGPNTVCQSASPAAITLTGASVGGGATTGAWSITSGGGTLSSTAQTASPATVTYTPAANYSGTVTLTLTSNIGAGCSVAATSTRTINVTLASTANSGAFDTVCQSATPTAITLTGASVGGGATTGAWSITSGGGTLSSTAQTASPASVTYTPAANYSGTVTLTLTSNFGTGCSAATAIRTITVTPIATATAAGPNTVCQSASPAAITLTGASVGGGATTGAWSITSGGGTLSSTAQTASPASVTYTPAANYSGTVTLTLTSNIGAGCSVAATSTRTINVTLAPVATAAGPDTVCQSATPAAITLTGASVGGGATTGAWSITSGGGTLSSTAQTATPATVTYTPAANYSGTVTLTLTSNFGTGCAAATSIRTINVTAIATATAAGPNTVCQSASPAAITLTGASVGGGATTGAWSITSGGGTLSSTAQTASPATVTYTPAANYSGTVTLTLTSNIGAGCSVAATSTRTINVTLAPIATAAGPNTVCQSATPTAITLTGASVSAGATTGAWSITSGGGTLSSTAQTATPASVTYTPAANYSGTVTLTLTSNFGTGCAAATSTRTINVTAIATATAAGPNTVCQSATPAAITLTGASVGGGATTGAWSITSGGGTLSSTAHTATPATVTYTPAANYSGTVTLTLTSNIGAGCSVAATSTRTINVTLAPVATAAGPDTVCQSATPTAITLTGASVSAGATTGAWSITSGGGTLSSTAQSATPATRTYTPAANFSGTVILTLTSNFGTGCAAATSTRTINVTAIAIATAAGPDTVCQSATPTAMTLTGASVGGGATTGAWSITSGGGTLSSTAHTATPATVTYTPAANYSGTVTLTLTSNIGAGCSVAATSTRTITVKATPTITGSTPGSRTGTGTVNLGATASAGTINWYAAATGGASLGTGNSFTTPIISTTTTYYVDATNNGCTTATRTAVVATVNYSEIDIQGNATTIVDGDTTPATADWTDFGTTNSTRTFTIRNVGTALLTVGAITFSGTNASEFTVTSAPSATVPIGSSTTFTVTFTPTAIGLRTANISIVNNDTNENPYNFAIQGTGVEQEIDIQGNAISIVDGDSTPTTADWTDFSTVAATRTFTIFNSGNIALTIGTITISGTNASDFTITTPPAASVGPNSSTTFVVTFSPSAINARTATISIVNNDNSENPYDFAIQGFGIIPEIDVQGNTTSIADGDLTPSSADWTDFGSSIGTRTFTILNSGNFPLTVGTISITGTNASEFTVTTPPSATVSALSYTTFVVTFIPTAVGVRTANISIVNDDTNENPYDFNIQGTGSTREIDLQGNGLSITNGDLVTSVSDDTDFGPADINLVTVTRTFTIRNTGSLPLTIANPTITGLNASEFSITANPGTLLLGAGSSTTFQVTFNPNAVFTRVAQINIVNNDSDENPYTFAIQGTGLLDNDGDGIENNADQDDDNDGIIDTVECGTCVSDPFVNGSFETPVIGVATYSIEPTANVTGWQTSAEPFIEIWSTGFSSGSGGPVPAAAGNQFAELNANVPGILYQTFCLNGAGGTINWAIKHRGRAGTDTAYVKFGDTLANAIASSPIVTMVDGNTSWGSYSGTYSIPLGQTNIVLTFQAGPTASGSASVGNFIDDVQIVINQNCIDTDSDGIADLLDVDDENDGIPDIEEAGFKAYSNGKSTMDRTSVATWVDANVNGLNDFIDSMITAGTYSTPDTDGDGIKNYLDLDSDNDSFFDVDESSLLNGDGDINGDGKGDGSDSDGDGLLNLYDNSTVYGTTARAYAQDTDGNNIPDYLEIDSDDDGTNDIQTGLYASFDTNADGRIDGTGDADIDGILDIFDTNDAVKGSPRDLDRKLFLDFDGRNDYAENTAILGGLTNATLMAWIDLNSAFSTTGVVVGQDKFHIRVSGSKILQVVANGSIFSYGTPLNASQWYHVAATYANGAITIYVNGKSVATASLSGAIASDTSKLTLGKNPVSAIQYFKGKIDEVRVFNTALTNTQIERMVYQEIQNTASQVRGAIVPRDIGSLPFANVLRYYRMDAYKDDIVDDLTTPSIDTGTGMKLYNHKVINVQQAPMPFVTATTGTFATAVDDASNDIRGLDVYDYDYSIIQVRHNITETGNSTDLALFVDPGVTVNMTNDTKLQNDWYLKLDGKIDLVGKSQFVQTANSELDVTSAGSLERDQQGQPIKFNYNYWSSPVSSINSTTINHGYSVAGVMKDGTDPDNIQNLQWTSGVNGSPTTPITLSSYWIFKFQNSSNSYANWASVGQNGTLLPGQGYTMKGSGSAAADQNYTFVGKPNNGTITSTVGPGNLNLCGNPYPSAIDADQFIDDNAASLNGTLYFWEHYNTNTSHATIQYQGGYATYTKTGGTAPVAPAGISGLGSSSKVAKRFIPVGQGFFVTGSATGGTITFNNTQRLFVKENDATSFTLFKTGNATVANTVDPAYNNASDTVIEEQFAKIRLGYNSADNYHRQVLLGFMNEHATAGYDNGYDALSIENLTNDMYFINGTNKLNISGDGYFNVNNIYPLGVKNAVAGNVTFVVDGKENFNNSQEIYIYDNVTSIYHSIKDQNFQINLPVGTYESRFSLRFTDGTALGTVDNTEVSHGISVIHSQANNMINIKNELQEVNVKSVSLYNLLGQEVQVWKVYNQNQADIQLRIADLSSGTYIVKVITDGGDVTKKIIIK